MLSTILWCSAFFLVQLLHPYMTTRETVAWTKHTELESFRLTVSQCTFRWRLAHLQSSALITRSSPSPQVETRPVKRQLPVPALSL